MMLMAFVAQAQTEHMKFMGIPLDGSIEQFTTKLLNKGMTKDLAHSKASEGKRVFYGAFFDKSATIVVRYDQRTLTVYAAKAYIEFVSREQADEFFASIKSSIRNKYSFSSDWLVSERFDRQEYDMQLYNKTDVFQFGRITIWYDEFNAVNVWYEDSTNMNRHDQNLNDDL